MDDTSEKFFCQMLETPSPSGYEQPVQAVVREWAGRFADEVRTDVHGNVIAVLNPSGSPRILLDGHCDQIALMVQHINDQGFLYVQPIGGWDVQILLGQNVMVWASGGPINGVISRKPPHLLKQKERDSAPEITDIWVDIGAKDNKEAASLVTPGDTVTPCLGMRRLRGDFVCGAKMDDTTGVFVVFEALRRLKGMSFAPSLHVVSAVQEEVGLRGATTAAFGVDPQVGIAVDVTHASDCPTIDKNALGEVKLGAGPVLFRGPNINPIVFETLREQSNKHQLPVQIKGIAKGASNDANVLQLCRAGVATGCLGIPNRYMHSPVETVSLADLDTAAELLRQFVLAIPAEKSFVP